MRSRTWAEPYSRTITNEIAPADTMLGRLQRGRGQGFREALAGDAAAATAAVVRCVTHDPRWDRQVEERDKYYADLAVALDLDLSPLEAHLREADREDAGVFHTILTIDVLALMARRGRTDTLETLRRYVASGSQWESAVEAMREYPSHLTNGLDAVLVRRFSGRTDLADALMGVDIEPSWEPWRTWLESNSAIREAYDDVLRQRAEVRKTRQTTGPLDIESLRRVVISDAPEAVRAPALIALGKKGDPWVVERAESAMSGPSERLHRAGRRALFHLARVRPVPQLRAWSGLDGDRGDVATKMLQHWGTSEDAPLLRVEIDRALAAGETTYRECNAVDGVVRLEDAASVPLLERVFVETTYAYLRVRAARGLSKMSPGFANELAYECLWDCESATRKIGCDTVELSLGRNRIAEVANDEVEDDDVKVSARLRLGL
jgi:hypothetical protein